MVELSVRSVDTKAYGRNKTVTILQKLQTKNLIHPPDWLLTNTHYLTIMGSHAYGTSKEDSDLDIYGFCTPKKDMVFPHLAGEIRGFGKQINRFEQWQESHIVDKEINREYDFTVFGIVRYFQLLMENNPNVLDSIWTPQDCVLHITGVGTLVRENRKIFLHKGCWPKFKGYAFSMLHKMTTKEPTGKRKALREEMGFDVKFAMHVVRLLYEAEQILQSGDMDIQRDREHLKAIRRGTISEEEIRKWASEKEASLEKLYEQSKLPWGPDEDKIKTILLQCLEHHYGDLSKAVVVQDKYTKCVTEIQAVLNKYS